MVDGNGNPGVPRVLQTQRAGPRIARASSLAAVLACFAASGCIAASPADSDPPAPTNPVKEPGNPASPVGPVDPSSPPTAPGAAGAVPKDLVATAVSDAAWRASVARDEVKVVAAERVTWPDGSLGCPQPGMMYTQALVPGYRIVLRAGGKDMHYHVGGKGGPTFCPPERVTPPTAGDDNRI